MTAIHIKGPLLLAYLLGLCFCYMLRLMFVNAKDEEDHCLRQIELKYVDDSDIHPSLVPVRMLEGD